MTAAPPRRPLTRLVWALALALLVGVPAYGTTKRPVEVTCPVCEHGFTAFVIGSTNSFGGTDFDFCRHARGEPPNSHYVWACPTCRYAHWADSDEFGEELDDDERAALRKALDAGLKIELDADQRKIPGRDKYALFLQVLEQREEDEAALAHVALLGAWVERLESPYIGQRVAKVPELRDAWSPLADEFQRRAEALGGDDGSGLAWPRRIILVATEMLGEPAPGSAARRAPEVRRLYAAWRLRARGENGVAGPALRALADRDDVHETVRAIALDLLASIEHETRLQARWLGYAKKALETRQWEGEDAAFRAHQIGDTYRRLGRIEEALAWYERALRDPHVPAGVFDVTRECAERWCGSEISEEELAGLRQARLEGLLDQLEDPETSYSAYSSLRVLVDPSTLPRLVAALGHENDDVRKNAALTLKFFPELPDEAVDALCKLVLEELDDVEQNAAYALRANGSARAREAFLVGLDSSTRRTQEHCVRGLGMAGEAEDVATLLEAVDTYPHLDHEVREALTQLTLRRVDDLAAFRTWWARHHAETRADWTKAVFVAAGVKLEGVDERTRQRRLIEALKCEDDHPLRCAAVRRLRELTGRRFGWEPLSNDSTSPRVVQERRMAVTAWIEWWEANER